MELDKDQKIEKCVSTDKLRKQMTAVYWCKKDGLEQLVATDGRRLVALPAKRTNESEEYGYIPVDALKQARNTAQRDKPFLEANGQIEYRNRNQDLIRTERPDLGNFPNYEQIIPDYKDQPEKDLCKVTFNAKLLSEVATALGSNNITITFSGDKKDAQSLPIYIEANNKEGFGLLMPLRA